MPQLPAAIDPIVESFRAELARLLLIDRSALPPAFTGIGPRILKRGIDADIIAEYASADHAAIKDFLQRYTTSKPYLTRMMRAKHRHDLNGNDVEDIRNGDRFYALRVLRQLYPGQKK